MISLNYRDSRPIYEQIRDGLRKLIVTGALAADEKLYDQKQQLTNFLLGDLLRGRPVDEKILEEVVLPVLLEAAKFITKCVEKTDGVYHIAKCKINLPKGKNQNDLEGVEITIKSVGKNQGSSPYLFYTNDYEIKN